MRIPSGVTDQYVYFIAVDSADFTTRETGFSSWTVYRSRNGEAAAAMTTPTINETDATNMPGVYELLLDEDMTIDAGDDEQEMVFHITHAGMAPVTRAITLFRPKITAGYTLSTAADGDLTKVNEVVFTEAQLNQIADHVIRRSWQNACDSADGDTKSFRSLLGAMAKLVNKVAVSGTTLTVYEDDDSTSLGTQTLTTDSGASPITEMDTED